MPQPSQAADQNMRKTLGIWLGSGGQAEDADQFKAVLDAIYVKVNELPWVTPGWLSRIRALQASNPDLIVLPSPVIGNNPIPDWIDTPEKAAFWSTLVQQTNDAKVAYGQALAAKGRAMLEQLVSDAAFWDAAYRFAVAIDPSRAVGRAVNSMFDSMGGTTKLLVGGALVVGGLYFASKMFGKSHSAPAATNPGRRHRRRR
jgi:hypothetical protein